MKATARLTPTIFILFCAVTLTAQQGNYGAPKQTIFEVLTAIEGAVFRLETDFTNFENYNPKEKFSGVFYTEEGNSYPIQLEKRGKFRLRGGEIPPLKLHFSKKDLIAAGLDTLNDMKLVVPFTLTDKGNELIYREYIAYRMFEHLSPYSFRARFIRVVLSDLHAGRQHELYCILLEDKDETLARLGGTEVKVYNPAPESLDAAQLALVGVFQYMIGNTDWDLSMTRNIRLMKVPGNEKIVAIPYDFDFSGLVNAFYACPSSESGLVSVRERWFMVDGISQKDLDFATQRLVNTKETFAELCQSPYLSKQASRDMIRFLDKFYQQLPTCKPLNYHSGPSFSEGWSLNK